jgi:hypothetical protein
MDVIGSGIDLSHEDKFLRVVSTGEPYYGPVYSARAPSRT